MLLSLALGAALSATVALAGTAQEAEAAITEKVVFSSTRTTGTGVNNPTGDFEIFKMNPDGTGLRQLTTNKAHDYGPTLSPDKTKVSYMSHGEQTSNPEGDWEVYVMNASDGSAKRNLTHNGTDVDDYRPVFSPGGKKIAYESFGVQPSNLEGDDEVYVMRALDGSAKKNLSNNGVEVAGAEPVYDFDPAFSPSGDRIAYTSDGKQTSNPEGDAEVYRMNALDGSGKKNLSDNVAVYDASPAFSPEGKIIAYRSQGPQTSNLEGDAEVYRMNALDGSGQTNLTHNGAGVSDVYPFFSSDGTKVFYESNGVQNSNLEGDTEIYRMKTVDGTGKKNLTHNGLGVYDGVYPD